MNKLNAHGIREYVIFNVDIVGNIVITMDIVNIKGA